MVQFLEKKLLIWLLQYVRKLHFHSTSALYGKVKGTREDCADFQLQIASYSLNNRDCWIPLQHFLEKSRQIQSKSTHTCLQPTSNTSKEVASCAYSYLLAVTGGCANYIRSCDGTWLSISKQVKWIDKHSTIYSQSVRWCKVLWVFLHMASGYVVMTVISFRWPRLWPCRHLCLTSWDPWEINRQCAWKTQWANLPLLFVCA